MAFEDRYVLALAAIVFAAILDGIDGRLARFLKGTSRFGAELDSLSDFVNFGVAPALILYFWGLHDLKSAGWIAAMVFAICAGAAARPLQRHDRRSGPAGLGQQFFRRHAGAGRRHHRAAADLCRVFLGLPRSAVLTWLTLVYTLAIAWLMVSRLPVFSGKRVGTRVPPEMVGPLIVVVVVLFIALLIAYPWVMLTAGTLAYLACLPFGWLSYRGYERRSRESQAETHGACHAAPASPAMPCPGMVASGRRRRTSIAPQLSDVAALAQRREDFVDASCPPRRSWPPLRASLAAPAIMRLARADAPPITLKLHHSFSSVSSVHDKFLAPWARKVESRFGRPHPHRHLSRRCSLAARRPQLFDQARDGDRRYRLGRAELNAGPVSQDRNVRIAVLPSRRALVSSKALQDFAALTLKDEFRDVHPICFSCARSRRPACQSIRCAPIEDSRT